MRHSASMHLLNRSYTREEFFTLKIATLSPQKDDPAQKNESLHATQIDRANGAMVILKSPAGILITTDSTSANLMQVIPTYDSAPATLDPFSAALVQLTLQLGLGAENVQNLTLLGTVQNHVLNQPSDIKLVFSARTKLSPSEIERQHPKNSGLQEDTPKLFELLTAPWHAVELQTHLLREKNRFTPEAWAALALTYCHFFQPDPFPVGWEVIPRSPEEQVIVTARS